jgi:ER membrane protein complex subunit 1
LSSSLKKTKVTILNPANGQKLEQLTLSSDDISSVDDIILVSRGLKPVIGWPDKARKSIKLNILGTKTIATFPISLGSGEILNTAILHTPNQITSKPHFLIQYQSANTHWGEVFHVTGTEAKVTVEKAYDVARLAGKGTVSTTVVDDKIYFTRIAQGTFLVLDSDENGVADHYQIPRFWIAGLLDYPDPILAVAEASPRSGSHKLSIRAATLFNTGDWALILNGEGSWVRHEGLGHITAAAFADLPKKQSLAHELEVEGHSSVAGAYFHRIRRHILDLQRLPDALQLLPEKAFNAVLGKSATSKDDNFGFHKHVVVATDTGRLIALDTSDQGKLVWSTKIPEFTPGQIPQLSASPSGIIRVKTDSSHNVFDSLTGRFLRRGTDSAGANRVLTAATSVRFVTTQSSVSGFLGDVHSNDSPIWTFYPQSGEVITNVTMRPTFDPVASIGDALGDRRVLYKYLNPNLLLVTAVSESTSSVSFYIVDGVSGNTVFTTTQYRVDISQPIPTLFSENFFIYSLSLSNSTQLHSRGYLLGIAKFYESQLPDDRGALGASTSFSTLGANSSEALEPHVLSQVFHIPEPLTSLAVSRTAQGISTRLLLATLKYSGGLLSMPLPALDPRRPVGRSPTKDEQAEGLMPYGPNLDFDPKWILSHKREVRGLETIIAAPSGMESTGLVFAYGGDVFGTRVTPSGEFDVLGEGFAKGNMVGTVIGLLVLVLGVAPVVARKVNGVRWSLPQ